jgi:ABC-type multidrug transport system permease subunit
MSGDQLLFEKWFLLDISNFEITILVFAYMLVALIFYYITLSWTNLMYGKYLKVLQASVAELVD